MSWKGGLEVHGDEKFEVIQLFKLIVKLICEVVSRAHACGILFPAL